MANKSLEKEIAQILKKIPKEEYTFKLIKRSKTFMQTSKNGERGWES